MGVANKKYWNSYRKKTINITRGHPLGKQPIARFKDPIEESQQKSTLKG